MLNNQFLEMINAGIGAAGFNKEPAGLYEPIRYILSLGGKRIRPVMLLMANEMYGGNRQHATPAALAIELFHNFSLIHDDIMDRAPLRRGKPTVHEKWDANTAILSGDTMLVRAYDQLLQLPERMLKPALETFNRAATEVCEGQQYDMDFENKDDVSIDEYLEMIRLKTAVLIGAALQLGGMAGNAPAEDLVNLYAFGMQTGMVFQLRDDFLDTYGDTELFGKRQYGDITTNKKTFLYLKALELTGGKDKDKLVKLYSDTGIDPEVKIKKVMKYFNKADIKERTEEAILEHYTRAQDAFHALQVPDSQKQPLILYTQSLMGRSF